MKQMFDNFNATKPRDVVQNEIIKLQTNLNRIEELYAYLSSMLEEQQISLESTEYMAQETQNSLERARTDLHIILKEQRKSDRKRWSFIFLIIMTGFICLFVVVNELVDVIKTFGNPQTVKVL